ncbi:unnamed protein product [Caenorhabditis angaria]|uniref:Uncharacterized protein n=1 Tax=Caenorhabditis angaria TaxID=860376 RepID=A0A9P1N7Z5_9PELO|nr:unnamed protein product [Caenorhabditis angaria]
MSSSVGRFANKVAIVTGSSSGIGRAVAVLFAENGAKVTITGRSREKLDETFRHILRSGISSENVNQVIGDIGTNDGQTHLIESTIQKFGKIDILVNNAGALITDKNKKIGIFQGIDVFDKNFDLNVRSVMELTQKAIPYLAENKGEIVNVSSIASGPQGHTEHLYYSVCKAAIDQLTRNLALQLISKGIRVNCVNPGTVITGFYSAMGLNDKEVEKFAEDMKANADCIPRGEVGKPEDIAKLIAFLADRDSSSYIIGQTITIDGGSTLVMGMLAGNSALHNE